MLRYATILAVSLSFLAFEASAHTKLEVSVPGEGALVAEPVQEIVLAFSDEVRLTAVTLSDGAGASKALGALPAEVAAKFVIAVDERLAAGAYTITWRAVGADTHIVSGGIHFSVGD